MIASGCCAAPAAAYRVVSASSDTAQVAWWAPQDPRDTSALTHTLVLASDLAQDEQLQIQAPDVLTLTGGGSASPVGATSSFGPVRAPDRARRDRCSDAPRQASTRLTLLTLPAGATATLTYTQHLSLAHPVAAPMDVTGWWWISRPGPVVDPGLRVTAPPPVLVGVRPSLVTLSATAMRPRQAPAVRKAGARTPRGPVVTARASTLVVLSGRVTPAAAGDRVQLMAWVPGRPRPVALGSAVIDRAGRYALRTFRPSTPGDYEPYAAYSGHPGRLEASRSGCPGPFLQITG